MEYVDLVVSHWPFVAMAVVGAILGQILKAEIFLIRRASQKGKFQWFWWWGYKLLPLWPMLLGVVIGVIWANPEGSDKPWPLVASVMYFAAAGGLSVWGFEFAKGIAKKKGLYLETPEDEKDNDGNNRS